MTQFQLKTPVVLIIFNRPDTTAKVFEVIRQVKPLQLFVIADAPRANRPGEAEKCMAAKSIINQVDWNCEVLTNYSEVNLGCRERVYSGLNWVFSLVESAIILEDDCVPHPTFFRFCQELLERYKNNDRIMAISGDNFQFGNNRTEYSYYFSRYPHCWGWATWRRAWENYDNQMQLWSELRNSNWLENILQNTQAVKYWSKIFQDNYQGFNSWAYAWLFSGWSLGKLTIIPQINLVSNIGFSPTATHTKDVHSKFVNMSRSEMIFPLDHPLSISRNISADDLTEKTMFSGSVQTKNVNCKVCGSISNKFDTAKILNKYNVDYFQCSNCGFVQTENPYWLAEAYSEVIASSDVGLVARNQNFSLITENLILNFFNANGNFLDYGCGYGLFVRMMRDLGLDFYGYDKYCQNIFYQGWEGEIDGSQKYEIVTAFEVFEHLTNPLEEINKILKNTRNILFSTKLLPSNNPHPNDWWYYALESGQHISIYTKKALSVIAQNFKLNLYSDGESLHLLTEQKLSNSQFHKIFNVARYKPENRKESLTQLDYEKITEKIKKSQDKLDLKVVIDGVFFQINNTGIARVWKSLLEVWANNSFCQHILVLDRAKTAPKIPGIKYRSIPGYNYGKIDADRQMLQEICDEENADIFISTYYTTPIFTPSIFMAYDMIPEVLAKNLDNPSWQEKHRSIRQAVSYIAISENTAGDLVKYFPQISANSITVAPCGIEANFYRSTPQEVTNFQLKYHINQPYFLIVGERIGWLGYKNTILFFQAFSKLKNSAEFDILCIGGNPKLEPELSQYISGTKIHLLKLSDEELKLAYSGAIALVYPSKYEGFGLPILEAMACGCPVITCKNASISEVAGVAALYINDNDVNGLVNALGEVQKSEVRQQLITAGLAQAQKFSWSQMTQTMTDVFIQTFNQIKVEGLSAMESRKNLGKIEFQINDGQLEMQRHFWNVNSLDEAMFGRVLAYKGIDTLSPEEKKQAWEKSIQNWIPQIIQNIPAKPHWKVLEIGCGVGRLIKYLRETFAQVDGVDISANMIQFAKQYLADGKQNGEVYVNNGCDLQQLADENYDFVFSTIVFQHIRSISIVKSYFSEIFRVLKPGGYFRIQVHDRSAESLGNFDEEGSTDKQYYFSGNAYTEEQLKELLIAAGFNLVSLESSKPWIWATVRREEKTTESREKFGQIVTLKNNQMGIEYPRINSLPESNHRPFWSVMIPTYKKVKYLEQTLKSVLQQALSPEEMQIEVVNDCPDAKIQGEIEAIVRKVGGERVNFYRHFPQDIGQAPIFNICLQRAKGYWVHLLHDDDFVLPGFYEKLRQVIGQNTTAGAAFCRHSYIDENNNQKMVSPLEKETPGIIPNWLEKIVVMQRIQCAAIVVKRMVYEELGGFCLEANSAADWEMWKRIAAYYSVSYEPQTLACYRLHSTSETSRLIKFGGNIADTRKAIEISESYLPPEISKKLSNQAREHYAISATKTAQQMLSVGKAEVAVVQIQEALKCSQSSQVKEAIISLFITSDAVTQINGNQLLSEVSKYVQEYQKDNSNKSALSKLCQLRQQIANYWLNLPTEKLESAYLGVLGRANQKLISSNIKYEQISETEKSFFEQIATHISQGLNQENSLQYLLAAILYYYPHQLSLKWFEEAPIPKWFVNDYMKFMIDAPSYFQEIGEANKYYRYTLDWINYLHQRIFSNSDSKIWQDIAWFLAHKSNFIPLYFNSENLKDIYIKRAEIMELALQSRGFNLDYVFPERPVNRNKIRLGVLSSHFIPQTETFSTLPFFEHLDKTKFEIILYAKSLTGHPLEKYCQGCAERLVKLPDNLMSQVETIRADDLDILLIGTNVTAITNPITLLALHRLARIQLTSTSSCVTTGMRHIDYYISGKLTEPKEEAQKQYQEKLITLKDAAHCFNYYATEPEKPVVKPSRESWGVSDKNIVFVSGANFYKIIPELRETWAKIIAAVPNSVLVLYPFNPNWSNGYQASTHFVNDMRSIFNKYGIDKKRLIVIKTLPSRSDIKECLKLCDVYLDSYPFAGVNSLIEPLEIGIPIVTKDGNSFRSLMGSALLRSLSIPDLIADREAEYINLAIKLANNSEFWQQKRLEIQAKMQENPPFLDSRSYSAQIGKLFQELFEEWQNIHAPKTIESTDENSLSSEFFNRLVGCVNLYEIDPTDQSLIEELRQLRKQIANFWLNIPPQKLETIYRGKTKQAYLTLLASGIQNEPQTEDEEKFLKELADTSMGLTNPKAINALLGGMLYFPPGKMLVRDAKNRLPQWLINDYKQVFENREVAQKLEKAFQSKLPHLSEDSIGRGLVTKPLQAAEFQPEKDLIFTENKAEHLDYANQKFLNQLFGSVNLYYIDPSDESVVQDLRQVRKQMADFWINLEPQKLETFYLGEIGKGYQALLSSGIQNQSFIESEQIFLQQLATQLTKGIEAPKAINYLLAVMLYCRPEQLRIEDMDKLPHWLLQDYQKFAGN